MNIINIFTYCVFTNLCLCLKHAVASKTVDFRNKGTICCHFLALGHITWPSSALPRTVTLVFNLHLQDFKGLNFRTK